MAIAVRRSAAAANTPAPSSRSQPARRPHLTVAPRRRRWPALMFVIAFAFVFAVMFGAAVFHTQLAERQLQIDRLERAVDVEAERFDELRYQRAELRSPEAIAARAGDLGMVRAGTTEFVQVTPEQLARQIAAAGAAGDDPGLIIEQPEPLDQVRDVKAVSAGQP